MMTVKVGELINQLRNTTVFGIVLCAIWILASFNIEASRRPRLLIQDHLAWLALHDGVNKSYRCLSGAGIGDPCALVVYHPWLDKAIYLDAFPLDGQLEHGSTGINYWKSDKVTFDIQSSDLCLNQPSMLFWELRPAGATDPANPTAQLLISDYTFVTSPAIDHPPGIRMRVVSLLKVEGDAQHKFVRCGSRYSEEADAWVASLGQGYPTTMRHLSLQDPLLSKLVHDFYQVENMHEAIAGLTIPLHYVPMILSGLLTMSSILLIGIASAFNMARHQTSLLTEEYGWPLLYSGGGAIGFLTFILGLALAILALSVPGIATYRTWVIAAGSNTREPALWVLVVSLGIFSVAISLNIIFQFILRQLIREKEANTQPASDYRERPKISRTSEYKEPSPGKVAPILDRGAPETAPAQS
jgi:hypothetical protein